MSELIDNRAHRIATLKSIVLHLHRGESPDAVRQRLADLVKEVDATEVAAMEQELITDGMSIDEIRSMCDLHAEVMRDAMTPLQIRPSVGPGHPVDTFQRENEALRDAIADVRSAIDALSADANDEGWEGASHALHARVNALFDVDKHYRRKEEVLFPLLERHGITGPSKVMWAKDDEVRGALDLLAAALGVAAADRRAWIGAVRTAGDTALTGLEGMIDKEERILFPMALDTLTRDEWGVVFTESPRHGWCLVEPRDGYTPPAAAEAGPVIEAPAGHVIALPTGHVTPAQLVGLLQVLPVDLTFVDADDRVAFYSEGPDRVFARSRAVVGRKVQHCHPPRSVAVVDHILDDFRAGRQSVAEFWIEMHGRFVHIRYFAVRDERSQYLGCLEVTQDVTKIRALSGERRLLHYDDAVETPAASASEGPARPTSEAQGAVVPPAAAAPPTTAAVESSPANTPVRVAMVVKVIDADRMLAAGTHPLHHVLEAAQALKSDQALAVDAGFVPEPLIDRLRNAGFDVSTAPSPDGRIRSTVRPRG